MTSYLFRHYGPSHDILTKARDLDAVKKRGRWCSERSVLRYEKAARVTSRLKALPLPTLARLKDADLHLRNVLLGHVPSPIPTSSSPASVAPRPRSCGPQYGRGSSGVGSSWRFSPAVSGFRRRCVGKGGMLCRGTFSTALSSIFSGLAIFARYCRGSRSLIGRI